MLKPVFLAALLTGLCLFFPEKACAESRKLTDLEAGDTTVKYFDAFFKTFKDGEVQVYQINPEKPPGKDDEIKNDATHLSGWCITSQKAVDAATVPAVRAFLLDPASFDWDWNGAYCFSPGMAFSFKTDKEQVNLIICLHCNWIYQYNGTKITTYVITKRGKKALEKIYKQYFEKK